MNCPKCGGIKIVKKGHRPLLNKLVQRYKCTECGYRFTPQTEKEEHEIKTGPKILILDVETAPMTVFTFRLRTDFIDPENVITPTFLICWSAKWFGDVHVMGEVLTSKEAKLQNDKRICESIHKLISQADLVVAYNGDMFDLPMLNTRFLVNELQPPSEYRSIDPIKTLKLRFRFDSNKLDFVNRLLKLERKIKTDFSLWIGCYNDNPDALDEMYTYNKQDTDSLEQSYIAIRPWIKTHPNVGVYFEHEGEICRVCGSTQVREVLDKYKHTNVGRYSLYRCTECGAESTGRHNELSKDKMKGLIK